MNKRLEAVISGRVQMVMFRDFAMRKARTLVLTGEVRNLPDGTVHVIAEGTEDALRRYEELLKRGPLLAHVALVESAWLQATDLYSTFVIRYE